MRLYLTGGSGLLGSNLIRVAAERYQVQVFAALHRRTLPSALPALSERVDLNDPFAVRASVKAFRPDVIVHCAYLNDITTLYRERRRAWQALVETTRNLAHAARETDALMIHISSDWVFDGSQGPADEFAPPNPINYYGVLKVVGETLATTVAERGAVARVAGVFGVNWAREDWRGEQNAGFGALVNSAVRGLREEGRFQVWTGGGELNQSANPTLASDAADLIIRLARERAEGIFHCVGGETVDRLELAHAAAACFDFAPETVQGGPQDRRSARAMEGIPVPLDTRLSGAVTEAATGRSLSSLPDALATFRRQLDEGVL